MIFDMSDIHGQYDLLEKRILCFAYNKAENKYYELDESGDFCAINKRVL